MTKKNSQPFPDGHFYSPIIDREDLQSRQAEVWPEQPEVVGIDFNDASHQQILDQAFPSCIADFDYPEHLEDSSELIRFYIQNSQFSWLDARTLFVLLRSLQPKRMLEVGSGYSSLLTADVNHRFLDNKIDFRCIEPYPRPFLTNPIPGLDEVIVKKVEQLPLSTFEVLEAGDILFIDSSHVSKTGSDVNYLYFEVLPRLKPGVMVHIHDIFLPFDYPKDWVLGEGRSWNEQYLLRALMIQSSAFRVRFGCTYAFKRYPDRVKQALALPSGAAFAGGSFWIERC